MKHFKFGICGAFEFERKGTGGQSVKTTEFYNALCERIDKSQIKILQSAGYKKNPFKFVYQFIKMMCESENVIIFPAINGIRIFAPLCAFLKKPCNTKTFYNVIGGWLPKLISEHRNLLKPLQSFDSIFVETNTMKKGLVDRGILNSYVLLNFKNINKIEEEEIRQVSIPVKMCYFSRVAKEKGVEDAIAVTQRINSESVRCTLDIYGQIVSGYEQDFKRLQDQFPEEIRYCGVADPRITTKVLKNYDIQLFPTHFRTEGIPGSIVDSYFSGLPVVASKWDSFSDVVDEDKTGIGFDFDDQNDFYNRLNVLITDPNKIMNMKHNCYDKATEYTPEQVMDRFFEIVERR